MKTIAIILMLRITLFAGCDNSDVNITTVIIRDNDFELVQTINQKKKIEEFKKHWLVKEIIELKKEPDFTHKIDIVSNDTSTRWLYDSSGYVRVLDKAVVPIYKIRAC